MLPRRRISERFCGSPVFHNGFHLSCPKYWIFIRIGCDLVSWKQKPIPRLIRLWTPQSDPATENRVAQPIFFPISVIQSQFCFLQLLFESCCSKLETLFTKISLSRQLLWFVGSTVGPHILINILGRGCCQYRPIFLKIDHNFLKIFESGSPD